jgi:hypothetical protein
MWLSILIVIALIGGGIIAIAGAGPIGIVLVAIGLIGLVAKFTGALGGQRSQGSPERAAAARRGENIGPAHEGQKHMTPEQI